MKHLTLALLSAALLTPVSAADVLAASAAAAPQYVVSPGQMLASFDVPIEGTISKWRLRFTFRTACENDHHIELASPTGRKLILMDRGLHRCSGKQHEFSSDNTDDGGAFVGSAAQGTWKLSFQDLDANKHTGALTKVRMDLAVTSGGKTTKYVVSLAKLPKTVPEPN